MDTDPAFAGPDHLPSARPGRCRRCRPTRRPPTTRGSSKHLPATAAPSPKRSSPAVETKISGAPCSPTCTAGCCMATTLELRFHLAVKARVRLLAKRRKQLVASTPMRTLAAGNRKLLLRLNPHELADQAVAADSRARAPADEHRQRSGGRPRTQWRRLQHGVDRSDGPAPRVPVCPIGIAALRRPRQRSGAALLRPPPLGALALVLVGALALALASGLPGAGSSRAAAQPASANRRRRPTPRSRRATSR